MAPSQDRLDLVQAVIADELAFDVSDVELRAGGTNYTIDTVRILQAEEPDEKFSLIIGSDQFKQLPQWQNVEKLITLTDFICLHRSGIPITPHAGLNNLRWCSIKPRKIDVSSTEIRKRIADGLSVKHLVPESALNIISERGLYASLPPSR